MALVYYRKRVASELANGMQMVEDVRMTLVPCNEYQNQQVFELISPKPNEHIPAYKAVMEHFDMEVVSFCSPKIEKNHVIFIFVEGRGFFQFDNCTYTLSLKKESVSFLRIFESTENKQESCIPKKIFFDGLCDFR